MTYHNFCFAALKRYLQQVKRTRKRYVTLAELKLIAKARGIKFSTRAVHNLRNYGLIVTVLPGVYEVNR